MKETGEWGMRAKPSGLGLRLKDVEVGSYGVVATVLMLLYDRLVARRAAV